MLSFALFAMMKDQNQPPNVQHGTQAVARINRAIALDTLVSRGLQLARELESLSEWQPGATAWLSSVILKMEMFTSLARELVEDICFNIIHTVNADRGDLKETLRVLSPEMVPSAKL